MKRTKLNRKRRITKSAFVEAAYTSAALMAGLQAQPASAICVPYSAPVSWLGSSCPAGEGGCTSLWWVELDGATPACGTCWYFPAHGTGCTYIGSETVVAYKAVGTCSLIGNSCLIYQTDSQTVTIPAPIQCSPG